MQGSSFLYAQGRIMYIAALQYAPRAAGRGRRNLPYSVTSHVFASTQYPVPKSFKLL